MKCTVLIVDDDDDIRETVAEALRALDHDVLEARDGQEALAVLSTTPVLPGLIVLDLMMPVMDGIEFRQRQMADARIRDIPVLVLSADSQIATRVKGLDVGDFLRKPVRLAALGEKVVVLCVGQPA